MKKNILIKGDNIEALNFLLNNGYANSVDLIYVDPPFATGCNFTIIDGRASTVSQSKRGDIAYTDKVLGNDFVESIRKRLLIAKKLLSDQGSIYLHTDYKIGHYIKVMMDEVFGIQNFRNDITRIKCNPKNFKRIGYGNIKDMILFYTKGEKTIWNEPKEPFSEDDIIKLYPKIDKNGKRYTTVPIHAPGETNNAKKFRGILPPVGRHWRTDVSVLEKWDDEGLIEWSNKGNPRKIVYADLKEGKRVQDIWQYKDPQYPVYPTEKNAYLLDLIVKTSSNVNSIVLDFYCGSGTTLKAAAQNGRIWIGIDESEIAIKSVVKKLKLDEISLIPNDYLYYNIDKNIGEKKFV